MKFFFQIFLLLLFVGYGELVIAQIPEGILANPSQFAEADTTEREVQPISPWKYGRIAGHWIVTNDSLLRWEIWPNWGDFFAYRKDVIAYRQGTVGRVDAFEIEGYSPHEQRIELNGIRLNNPITGYVNYNHIPSNRIGLMTESKQSIYESHLRLRDYYLVEPLSYLNFDESALDYRNLEFMVAQNFSERTNVELSFWDRRDGGYYPVNEVQGSQILMKGYHYLSQNLQLRTMILRNQFKRDESFGYVVNDPLTFAFSQFATQPNKSASNFGSTSGYESDILRRDFKVGLYSRPDSLSEENSGIEFFHSKNDFGLPFDTDTLSWDVRTQALSGFRKLQLNNLNMLFEGSMNRYLTKKNRNISISNWNTFEFGAKAKYQINEDIGIFSNSNFQYRSDSESGYSQDFGIEINPSKFKFYASAGLFSRIPTIQQKFWNAPAFSGNAELENVEGVNLSSSLDINWNSRLTSGASVRWQNFNSDIFIGTDSTFVTSDSYSVLSGSMFGRYENHRFYVESSATVHAALATNPTSVLDANNKPDRKVWVRNNAYIKGYVFDRAAYVKLGLLTTFSPFPYRSRLFNTELQYWENAALNEVEIPAYFRMDAELSARVRSMMIVMRWENALDGFGQLGYFEAATLPMPGRRLIVGIRAQFRN